MSHVVLQVTVDFFLSLSTTHLSLTLNKCFSCLNITIKMYYCFRFHKEITFLSDTRVIANEFDQLINLSFQL